MFSFISRTTSDLRDWIAFLKVGMREGEQIRAITFHSTAKPDAHCFGMWSTLRA
jgi:hypothetical protein